MPMAYISQRSLPGQTPGACAALPMAYISQRASQVKPLGPALPCPWRTSRSGASQVKPLGPALRCPWRTASTWRSHRQAPLPRIEAQGVHVAGGALPGGNPSPGACAGCAHGVPLAGGALPGGNPSPGACADSTVPMPYSVDLADSPPGPFTSRRRSAPRGESTCRPLGLARAVPMPKGCRPRSAHRGKPVP